MKNVLIVDDETIVRVTLRAMIRWEDYGMRVAADCNSGYAALEYVRAHPVDLLIVDMKMPEMSGIELLRRLKEEGETPVALVLSGYNEFELVREAFRLGAYDYVLKADLNEAHMDRLLKAINETYWKSGGDTPDGSRSAHDGTRLRFPADGAHGVCVLEVDDFFRQAARFGENLGEQLEKPMLELANQIPRVSRRGRLTAVQPGHYLFFYEPSDAAAYRTEMLSTIRRMQAVWRDYMNLTVSAAVCDLCDAAALEAAAERAERLLVLAPLGGKASLSTEWEHGELLSGMDESAGRYGRLIAALYEANEPGYEKEKQALFQQLEQTELSAARTQCLRLIVLLAGKFREYEEDFFAVFPEEVNYYEKVARLHSVWEIELWLNNYFRWEMEYLGNRMNSRQVDTIRKAKRFIADNYTNPELTLGSVADYVGLNEKYFTTRFTKETGSNFRDYLTRLRLARAQKLIETTELKMYEISEHVGYNNVEHFNRMFKKYIGISPGDYKREKRNT